MASTPPSKDFKALREAGLAPSLGRAIGWGFCTARDGLAGGLLRLGATPNRVTFAGFLLTVGCGWCLALGASHQVPYWLNPRAPVGAVSYWPLWAGLFLIASAACDMLDGAVARLGQLQSSVGEVLDSTLDRFSDCAILLGIAAHFAWTGNVTYTLLAFVALSNTFLISYIKARAEDVIADCSVGWWQRGERYVALLLGCFFGHMPAVLWQLAVLPALTVWRRLWYAYRALRAHDRGQPPPPAMARETLWGRIALWHYPRGSWQHDIVAAVNISYIIFAPLIWSSLLGVAPWQDPLRQWLTG